MKYTYIYACLITLVTSFFNIYTSQTPQATTTSTTSKTTNDDADDDKTTVTPSTTTTNVIPPASTTPQTTPVNSPNSTKATTPTTVQATPTTTSTPTTAVTTTQTPITAPASTTTTSTVAAPTTVTTPAPAGTTITPIPTTPPATPVAAPETPAIPKPDPKVKQILISIYIQNNSEQQAKLTKIEFLLKDQEAPLIKDNLNISIKASNIYSRGVVTAFDITTESTNLDNFSGIQSITINNDRIVFANVKTGSTLSNPIKITKKYNKWVLDK